MAYRKPIVIIVCQGEQSLDVSATAVINFAILVYCFNGCFMTTKAAIEHIKIALIDINFTHLPSMS